MGPAGGLVDALVRVLSDEDAKNRYTAIQDLGRLGPRAAPAVPKLLELLTEYLTPVPPGAANQPDWRRNWGPGQVPDLRVEIIETLGQIGPGAKAALPLLEGKAIGQSMDLDPHAEKAILQIKAAKQGDEPQHR